MGGEGPPSPRQDIPQPRGGAPTESERARRFTIILFLALVALAFAGLSPRDGEAMHVVLQVEGIGAIPIELDGRLRAAAVVHELATKGQAGKVHRAEPLPPAGSSGPPYALVQASLAGLDALKHEGTGAKISRGAVCLIGGTSDIFVSLARGAEHDGWEASMTILGSVPEPALTQLVEGALLAQKKHNFTHPTYGTVMSMLDVELPCRLGLAASGEES